MSSSFYQWGTRCLPAFSIAAIAILLALSFLQLPHGYTQPGHSYGNATVWQLILSILIVFLHIESVLFPARVFFSMGNVTKRTREWAEFKDGPRSQVERKNKDGISCTTFAVPFFVIILPAYKEETDTLRETLRVLASHPQARSSYHVYLAMEEKEEKADLKAQELIASFSTYFSRMSFTIHPSNIPGEAQGKSSNEAWAAKQIMKDYPNEAKSDIIVTVMDADTHLSSRYFAQIARAHFEEFETNQNTIYVPPLVFDRNLHQVPLPVRIADLMWAGAGISSFYENSTVCIPTSVYSLSMTLVERVGGWDTDPCAIGEDLHMYVKCFYALSGHLKTKVIYAAASQCNVSSDVKGVRGYVTGLQARYKQALRHMWGSLDTGFSLRQMLSMIDRHRKMSVVEASSIPLSAPNANWTAFYSSTGLYKSLSPKADDEKMDFNVPAPKSIHISNCLTLTLRLFEAHFVPIHLSVVLTVSGIYSAFIPPSSQPVLLRLALDFAGWCRLAGFALMLAYFSRYEAYHKLCVSIREQEMSKAGLLEDLLASDGFSMRVFPLAGVFEGVFFPIGGFIFGAVPAMQAVISHLFTDRLTYVVSLKPQLALKKMISV